LGKRVGIQNYQGKENQLRTSFKVGQIVQEKGPEEPGRVSASVEKSGEKKKKKTKGTKNPFTSKRDLQILLWVTQLRFRETPDQGRPRDGVGVARERKTKWGEGEKEAK